jgi:hypothetical protein
LQQDLTKRSLHNCVVNPDSSAVLRTLDPRQRAVLTLFKKNKSITAQMVAQLLKVNPRTARALCNKWVADNFLEIADPSKKNRSYWLTSALEQKLFD